MIYQFQPNTIVDQIFQIENLFNIKSDKLENVHKVYIGLRNFATTNQNWITQFFTQQLCTKDYTILQNNYLSLHYSAHYLLTYTEYCIEISMYKGLHIKIYSKSQQVYPKFPFTKVYPI